MTKAVQKRVTRQQNSRVKYNENSDSSDDSEASDFEPGNTSDHDDEPVAESSTPKRKMVDMLKAPRKRKAQNQATSPKKRRSKPTIAARSIHR